MKQLVFLFMMASGFNTANERSPRISSPELIYVGSTPAGNYIKSSLKISPGITCEFIKWTLTIKPASKTFTATIWYGESQPSTTGFKNGGMKAEISGNYTAANAATNSPAKTNIVLQSPQLNNSITLLKLDNNLLYFIDGEKKLLIGNGGFAYLLNRQIENHQ